MPPTARGRKAYDQQHPTCPWRLPSDEQPRDKNDYGSNRRANPPNQEVLVQRDVPERSTHERNPDRRLASTEKGHLPFEMSKRWRHEHRARRVAPVDQTVCSTERRMFRARCTSRCKADTSCCLHSTKGRRRRPGLPAALRHRASRPSPDRAPEVRWRRVPPDGRKPKTAARPVARLRRCRRTPHAVGPRSSQTETETRHGELPEDHPTTRRASSFCILRPSLATSAHAVAQPTGGRRKCLGLDEIQGHLRGNSLEQRPPGADQDGADDQHDLLQLSGHKELAR
jgi:hypothetical protein